MTDPRWQRIKDLFAAVAGLPEGEREAFLARECEGEPEVRREVESLLAAHRPTAGAGEPPKPPGEGPGSRVGPYRLLEEIGEGGFGTVYLAEQEKPVRRRVALKVIKAGMDTRQVVARFEQERQALALMDHPGIARVFDGGQTESGRPYFVMELVRGDPITTYCDREKLSTRERLEIFAEVCRAVQHAHQKGVIHRDIKPSNVLVTIVDGKPVPKVIDFGVAKATQGRLTEKTLFTEHRQMIGTPLYMSPEQAHLSGVDVDTRSDVYSLGVLLYELLTGVPPFDQAELLQAGIAEMHRMIRELEPKKPSTRVATLGPKSTSVAAQRRVDPAKLGLLLRGDLDWIVMRCLEKERARRYDTASDLAQDVGRHLAGEPVEAAPPSAVYRLRKLVRRYRMQTLAGAVIAIALLVGIVGTSMGMAQVRKANHRLISKTDEAEWNAYEAGLLVVQRDLAAGDYPGARLHLSKCSEERRGWEWDLLFRIAQTVVVEYLGDYIQWSPDGEHVLTYSEGIARLWDLGGQPVSREMLCPEPQHDPWTSIGFSPDGRLILARSDRTATLWNQAGEPIGAVIQEEQDIKEASFSPDGGLVMTRTYSTVRLWDLEGRPVGEVKRAVEQAGFSPDGRVVLTLPGDQTARLWDLQGHALGKEMRHEENILNAGFSPDGKLVWTRSKDDTARLWSLEGHPVAVMRHEGDVDALQFSPDGRYVLTRAKDRTARVWDLVGNPVGDALRHQEMLYGAAFSPDGRLVLTWSDDGTARLWDLEGRPVGDVMTDDIFYPIFSPDSRRVLTRSRVGICLWDTGGRIVPGSAVGAADLTSAEFTPGGEHVLLISSLGYSFSWESNEAHVLSPDGVPQSYTISPVYNAEFQSEGELVLSKIGYGGDRSQLWSPATRGVPERRLKPGSGSDLAASMVLEGHGTDPAPAFSTASLVSAWKGHAGEGLQVQAIVACPDGSRVITGGDDATVRFWETSDWRQVASIRLEAAITDLQLSPDATQLVIRLATGSVHIWDTRDVVEQREDLKRMYAERGPAAEYLNQLLSGPTPNAGLSAAVLADSSLSPLRRLVVAEMLEDRSEIMDYEADQFLGSLTDGATDADQVLTLAKGLAVEPRIKERVVALATVWQPHAEALNKYAWQVVARPGASVADISKALAAARKAVDLNPRDGDIMTTLGAALYRTGDYPEAREVLEAAKWARGGVTEIGDLAFLAMTEYRAGQLEAARSLLSTAKKMVAVTLYLSAYDEDQVSEATALIEPAESGTSQSDDR